MFDDRGPRYLLQEALTEHPLDSTTGVIRPEAEQEGGAHVVASQDIEKPGNPCTGSSPRIDVNLEGKQFFDHLADQLLGIGNTTTVVVKYSFECFGHTYRWCPVEIALRVFDLGYSVLNILIPRAVIFP